MSGNPAKDGSRELGVGSVLPPPGQVLIIGVGGMLARGWDQVLRQRGVVAAQPTLQELDLTDPRSVTAGIDARYRLVVNCAAWTDVDGAEKREAEATAINGTGVGELARRCAEVGATLVHYSTDYVFRGDQTRPIATDGPRQPLNAYGRSKAVGEELIEKAAAAHSGFRYLLIRTSWLYAPWGNNFVRVMVRLARKGGPIRVVNDQRGRPTSAEHLARTTLKLLEHGARGIYNVTDGGECTWYEFAREIVGRATPGVRVEPCTTAEFPRPARRPAYSTLDLTKTEALVGPMPSWQENLGDVMQRLEPI